MSGIGIILFTIALFYISPVVPKDIDHNTKKNNLEKTSIAWTASWSYDDKFVAIGNDNGEINIYETKKWRKIRSWKYGATTITRLEWNPKYPILAVASVSHQKNDSIIQLINFSSNKILKFLPPFGQGRGITWSSDGEKVAFVGKKGSITIYSKNGEILKTLSFRNNGSLFDIDWHPTKNILLAVEEKIYLIDIDRDSLIATYDHGTKNKGILCCQWHTSGDFFVTGDYGHENEGGQPSYLTYWMSNGKLIKRIEESKFEYRNLKWTKDGKFLAAASDVLLILNDKGEVIEKKKFDDHNLWGVEWSNTGNNILLSDQAGNIRICNIHGKILKKFKQ
jgi:WD40 repeat protein